MNNIIRQCICRRGCDPISFHGKICGEWIC